MSILVFDTETTGLRRAVLRDEPDCGVGMKDKLRELAKEMRNELCGDFAQKLEAILDAEGDGGAEGLLRDAHAAPGRMIAKTTQNGNFILVCVSTLGDAISNTHPARSIVVSDEDVRDAIAARDKKREWMQAQDGWKDFMDSDFDSMKAALQSVAPPKVSADRDAYEGAREDLLDWKRRAQRAEAMLRSLGYTGIDATEPPGNSHAAVWAVTDHLGKIIPCGNQASANITAETYRWEVTPLFTHPPARAVSDADVEVACCKYYNSGNPVYPPVFEAMRAALEHFAKEERHER
jgi:hypothetical protein